MKTALLLAFMPLFSAWSQDTLVHTKLEAVVITATRSERSLAGIPVPVTVVDKNALKTMGSVRLQDALAEQTGLVIVPQINAQGNGLQLQGFNPDYTLILIDGEPLIGRYTGSLELSRITTGNIRQIEIVKGPSSSLYGSEALAGVVNIITDQPSATGGEWSLRYGTNKTMDLSGSGNLVGKTTRLSLFANRFETDGYDLSPQNFGKTVSPFVNYTFHPKLYWKPSRNLEVTVSSRFFSEDQQFAFDVRTGEINTRTRGNGVTRDLNIHPTITKVFSSKLKATARFYGSQFETETELKKDSGGELFYRDDFRQQFLRPELVAIHAPNRKHTLTYGVGLIGEQVNTSRYGDLKARTQTTAYSFVQEEWNPTHNINLVSGIRLDQNSIYGSQLSPKLSGSARLNDQLLIRISAGTGFKAPDFRQLYFNFTNSAAGGYAVLGSEIIDEKLKELEALGQIENYLFNPENLERIRAERSASINAGIDFQKGRTKLYLNIFHNEITNLIENQAVATTTSGQGIFTYRNINQAFTRGAEAGLQVTLSPFWSLNAGHQLLYAMDRLVLNDVRDGNYFSRDPETLVTTRLKRGEYFGLQNRSRHSGNFKLNYKDAKGWEASMRLIWRSRFGVGDIRGNIQGETIPPSDINSNGILDRYDNFVSGFLLTNISLAKEFESGIRLQVGIDNLLNHREPIFIPNLPGRLFYTSIAFKWNSSSTTN